MILDATIQEVRVTNPLREIPTQSQRHVMLLVVADYKKNIRHRSLHTAENSTTFR